MTRIFDHLDELVSAHSLAFDATGTRLYAGLKNELRIFDVNLPGRKCTQRKTWTKKEGGQPGIVSCIAVNIFRVLHRGKFFCLLKYRFILRKEVT